VGTEPVLFSLEVEDPRFAIVELPDVPFLGFVLEEVVVLEVDFLNCSSFCLRCTSAFLF